MKRHISIVLIFSMMIGMMFDVSAASTGWCEDFEDGVYSFASGGGPALGVVDNPDASVGGSVLKYSQGSGKEAAWIQNNDTILAANSEGIYKVGVDLYIPDTSLTASGHNVDIKINNSNNHRIILVSDTVAGLTAFQSNSFPKNEWFTVVFEFNFSDGKYDVYIQKNGVKYATHFSGRNMKIGTGEADDIVNYGVKNIRLFMGGADQMIYADNYGVKEGDEPAEPTPSASPAPSVSPEPTAAPESFGIYDFESTDWTDDFDKAGSATYSIVTDPVVENNRNVLKYEHTSGQSASWIRNKLSFGEYTSGKYEVGVDLFVPDTALVEDGSNIRFELNNEATTHYVFLDPEGAEEKPGRISDFPRNCWFRLRFVIDLDNNKYNAEIVKDGVVLNRIWESRGATSIKNNGLSTARLFFGEPNQYFYAENLGISEFDEEIEIIPSVKFIRIDGVNAAGEELSIYGDFAGGADSTQLADIVWMKSDKADGEYTVIDGANSLSYTPETGGYYLKVSAKFGDKTLETYPVYIREDIKKLTLNPYLSCENKLMTAAVAYINEGDAVQKTAIVAVYDEKGLTEAHIMTLDFKAGSDLLTKSFELTGEMTGKTAKLMIVDDLSSMRAVCAAEELSKTLPKAEINTASTGSYITLDNENIAIFKENRYMRFRSGTNNDHWIGTAHNPSDMGFAYQEKNVAGFKCNEVKSESVPGAFKISFSGEKTGLDTTQVVELIGFWDEEMSGFNYIRNASLTADTQMWHSKSGWAPGGGIEVFDYCIERMSILDRVYNNNLNGDLYDYVIYTNDMKDITRIPKLPVPRTMLSGTYFYDFWLSPGGKMIFADPKEGGWEATLISDTGDTRQEICWSWYDIHNCVERTIPQIGAEETFTGGQSWLYTKTTPENDEAVIDKAVEIEYKHIPNYQLPTFGTENTFDTQFGGIDWCYAWWKSSYDCYMDSEVGREDSYSVRIEHSEAKENSWYTEGVWGYPYSFDDVKGKNYILSGWIKTENVVGEAYIANNQYLHATPGQNTLLKTQALSGTNDWTYVEVEFIGQQRPNLSGDLEACIDHFFLTLDGSGKAWFDDVKITQSDKVNPKTVIKTKLNFDAVANTGSNGMRMWYITPPAIENDSIKNEVADINGENVLKTTVMSGNSVNGSYIPLEVDTKNVISFNMMIETGNGSVVMRPGASEGTIELLSVDENGSLFVNSDKVIENVYGKWLSVTAVADTKSKLLDLYINGERAVSAMALSDAADYTSSNNEVRFILNKASDENALMYLDNLFCYEINLTTVKNGEMSDGKIALSFDNPIDPDTVAGAVRVTGEGDEIECEVSASDDLTVIYITPSADGAKKVLISGIKDVCGNDVPATELEL